MTRALVMGGGGVVGTAWMTGLVSGLRRAGVDLAEADVIVGTSAGSIVGTMLAAGQDFDSTPVRPADQGGFSPQADRSRLTEAFAILADTSLEPADARRRDIIRSAAGTDPSKSMDITEAGSRIHGRKRRRMRRRRTGDDPGIPQPTRRVHEFERLI